MNKVQIKQSKSVLIVEDDEDLGELIAERIQDINQDLNVFWVGSVSAALDKLKNQTFDCLVVDLHLGSDSGEKVISYAKDNETSLNKDTPIILSSGTIDLDVVKRLKKHVDDAVVKPFDFDVLAEKVKALIGSN